MIKIWKEISETRIKEQYTEPTKENKKAKIRKKLLYFRASLQNTLEVHLLINLKILQKQIHSYKYNLEKLSQQSIENLTEFIKHNEIEVEIVPLKKDYDWAGSVPYSTKSL